MQKLNALTMRCINPNSCCVWLNQAIVFFPFKIVEYQLQHNFKNEQCCKIEIKWIFFRHFCCQWISISEVSIVELKIQQPEKTVWAKIMINWAMKLLLFITKFAESIILICLIN